MKKQRVRQGQLADWKQVGGLNRASLTFTICDVLDVVLLAFAEDVGDATDKPLGPLRDLVDGH